MEGIAAAVLAGARRHTEGGSSLCPQLLVPAACLVVVLVLAVRPVTSGELNAVVLSSEPIVDGVPSNSAIEKENVQLPLVWRFMPPFGSLQLAYQRGTAPMGEASDQGSTLFSKLTWVF